MLRRVAHKPASSRVHRAQGPARCAGAAAVPTIVGNGRAPTCACGGRCPRCAARAPLRLAPADAPHEREADGAARRRLWGERGAAPSSAARAPAEEGGEPLGGAASDRIEQVLAAPGEALPPATRSRMESQLGASLADVRVHRDRPAHEAARGLGAAAFSVGRSIAFAEGAYDPDTLPGQALLAHELQHAATAGRSTRTVHRSLETYVKAMNRKPEPDWALAAEHLNGESPAIIKSMLKLLDPPRRAKLHAAARGFPGVCSNIARFTEREYLALNPTVAPTDYSKCGGGAAAPATPAAPAGGGSGASFKRAATSKDPRYSNEDSVMERRTSSSGAPQVYLEGPTFSYIASVSCSGTGLGDWQVGHVQDLTAYDVRGRYSDGSAVSFEASFPIRDSADDALYPFYYKSNVKTAAAGTVDTPHMDSPSVTFDSELNGANLTGIEMKFSAIDWVVARHSTTGTVQYVHYANWGFARNLTVPAGSAALPDPTATNDAISHADGMGPVAPSMTKAVYNKSAKAKRTP